MPVVARWISSQCAIGREQIANRDLWAVPRSCPLLSLLPGEDASCRATAYEPMRNLTKTTFPRMSRSAHYLVPYDSCTSQQHSRAGIWLASWLHNWKTGPEICPLPGEDASRRAMDFKPVRNWPRADRQSRPLGRTPILSTA